MSNNNATDQYTTDIIYKKGSDLKLLIELKMDGSVISPTTAPFEVRLWTGNKDTKVVGGWNGNEWYGCCKAEQGNAFSFTSDAPSNWWSGPLKGEALMYYPDSTLPDGFYTKIVQLDFKSIQSVDINLAAFGYYLYEIALAEGFIGTRQQFIDSLKGEKGDKGLSDEEHADLLKTISDGKQALEEAKEAKSTAEEATKKLQEATLGTWAGVAVSKDYYAELQKDATKWRAFMAKYNGYMLYIINSSDTEPITPTPPVSAWTFGGTFPIKFHSKSSTSWTFGNKFPIKFNS